jgi:hypothetical protein
MNLNEKTMLKDFIEDFQQKEEKRKILRGRIVKALDRIELELYDDKDSSNEGLLTRVNNLEQAIKEIANMIKDTRIRNNVILGILGALGMAVISQLLSHYVKLF